MPNTARYCEDCVVLIRDCMLGNCSGKGGTCAKRTTSASLMYCDSCAAEANVCVACGKPHDPEPEAPHTD